MAQGSHKMQRTMSVEQVVRHADEPFFDAFYSPKNWFRSADAMLKQASVYEHEGDLQTAYFLLYRHAKLILDLLPAHSDAQDPQYRPAWVLARKAVGRSLAKLEELKPRINRRYERYQERLRATASAHKRDSISNAPPQLDPTEHVGVAVELANSRFRLASHSGSDLERQQSNDQELGAALLNARRRIDHAEAVHSRSSQVTTPPRHPQSNYHYPTVSSASHSPPDLPPKAPISPSAPPPPPRPSKVADSPASRPGTPHAVQQFAATSQLEDGSTLRTVFLPAELRGRFLALAAGNTARGIETLGLLCGALVRNAFFVTHLLVPPQTATRDTCEMTAAGETALDGFVSEADLLVLGWIHTHPTQSCFMSSRDLHTHVWYQASLPEAVAVVCAPAQRPPADWGVFRLTCPPGMGIVRACTRPGIFHPHDEPRDKGAGIYTDAVGQPGHVVEARDMPLEVADLRHMEGP